eukprot:TRINITY_DN10622_c0_g1_i3.p1 TRINITY_DN10622_c0_g1~~TRINITY_DN10622_c0_g1_i3.p1  ORF type:complete len:157 (+),score=34.01 TRINITY_DN10622_c0_g1_i3:115-585(+)
MCIRDSINAEYGSAVQSAMSEGATAESVEQPSVEQPEPEPEPEPEPAPEIASKPAAENTSKPAIDKNGKVIISLNAVGDAPILKQKVFKTSSSKPFSSILTHLCSQLKYDQAKDPLYVFCNKAFIPCPDHLVGDLATNYHSDGRLQLYYATNAAWG